MTIPLIHDRSMQGHSGELADYMAKLDAEVREVRIQRQRLSSQPARPVSEPEQTSASFTGMFVLFSMLCFVVGIGVWMMGATIISALGIYVFGPAALIALRVGLGVIVEALADMRAERRGVIALF